MSNYYAISIVNYLDSSVEKGIDDYVKQVMSILKKKHNILLETPSNESELAASFRNIEGNGKGILLIACHSNLDDGIARTQSGSDYPGFPI